MDLLDDALEEYAELLATDRPVEEADNKVLRDGRLLARIARGLARALQPQRKRLDDEAKLPRNSVSDRVRSLARARVQLAQEPGVSITHISLVELRYAEDKQALGDLAAQYVLAAGATFGTYEARMTAIKHGAEMREVLSKLNRAATVKRPQSRSKGNGSKSQRKTAAASANTVAATPGATPTAKHP